MADGNDEIGQLIENINSRWTVDQSSLTFSPVALSLEAKRLGFEELGGRLEGITAYVPISLDGEEPENTVGHIGGRRFMIYGPHLMEGYVGIGNVYVPENLTGDYDSSEVSQPPNRHIWVDPNL